MGVGVTFIAILVVLKESIIEVVQADEYAPLHVRAASAVRLVGNELPVDDMQDVS
jgi:segregation and condensation protein A